MERYTVFLVVLGLVASVFGTTVSGTLQTGESLEIDGIYFQMEDIEYTTQNAIISIWDGDGNLLGVDEIQEGKSITKSAGGRDYVIYVNKTAQGLNYIAKWGQLTVTSGPAYLNVGELVEFEGLGVRLDDIERDTRSAALTLLEGNTEVSSEEVPEGGYIVREVGGQRYKISVAQTASGYEFRSKWAKLSAEPTSLPESPNDYAELDVGEVMEEGSLRLRLDDIERDTNAALVSILDSDGNVLSQDEIPVGGSIIRAAEDGQRYQIRAYATLPGMNFIAKWAKFTVTPTSLSESRNYPTINKEETLTEGDAQVTLEDIERGSSAALLILSDGTNTYREKLQPGRYVIRTLGGQRYKIQVYQTAPGVNFVAKWVKLTVQPTTLAESALYAGTSQISVGEAAESPDGDMRVRLDDIERDTNYALVSIIDSGDNVVWRDEIKTGGYIIVDVDGTKYLIRSYETAPGIYFTAKWARLRIQTTTLAAPVVAGEAVNIGGITECAGGGYKVRLDDIERDSRDAIITILDWDDNEVLKEKVPDGQQKNFNLDGDICTVKATRTAPGLNFIAKWARLQTN